MYKDLEFEFPHKVYVQELKADIMNVIKKEEDKFEEFTARQLAEKRSIEEEEIRKLKITYEKYFDIPLHCIVIFE